jgi:hypothetical protein
MSPRMCSNVVKPWLWCWGAHSRGSGVKTSCTKILQRNGRITKTGSATRGGGASLTPRRGLDLETLGCAQDRTRACFTRRGNNHGTKARVQERDTRRVARHVVRRRVEGCPSDWQQKNGQTSSCWERLALEPGVATVQGSLRCGAVRRPFMEKRRTTARRRAHRHGIKGKGARGREVTALTAGRRCIRHRPVEDGGAV